MIERNKMSKEEFRNFMLQCHPDFKEHLSAVGKKIGWTELAMHQGDQDKIIEDVLVGENGRYAFGLTTDGHMIHGLWNEHHDSVGFS